MLIFKATNTLEGYLPDLQYTEDQSQAEMLLVGGKKFALSEFPKLRGIFKTGVGTDNLPFEEATSLGIDIELPSNSTKDIIYEETSAFTCHLILRGLYSDIGDWDTWKKIDRKALHQHRLLVVGAGNIGGRVADKMKAFMEVDTFDIAFDAQDEFESKVRQADCISLHVPLTPETNGLFNAERLAWMRDGSLLVNTARGTVVDEDALFAELSAGRLRAAIDVFWQEPYQGKLTALAEDRFIRTPHISSTCQEFLKGTADDFLKFLQAMPNNKD